jgi:hypothetical protein
MGASSPSDLAWILMMIGHEYSISWRNAAKIMSNATVTVLFQHTGGAISNCNRSAGLVIPHYLLRPLWIIDLGVNSDHIPYAIPLRIW